MGINVKTKATYLGGEIGRHAGLKILWAAMSVRVQVPPEVQILIRESQDFFYFTLFELMINHVDSCDRFIHETCVYSF
jgi:hypothetical protein